MFYAKHFMHIIIFSLHTTTLRCLSCPKLNNYLVQSQIPTSKAAFLVGTLPFILLFICTTTVYQALC